MSEEAPKSYATNTHISFALGTFTVWANTYDSTIYSSELTDNLATTEEINAVLKSVQSIRKPFVIKKCLGSILCFILLLLGPVVMVIFLPSDNSRNPGVQIALDVIGTIIYLMLIFMLYIRYHDKADKITKTLIDEYLSVINPSFLSRGLRWCVSTDPSPIIELWKEYKSGNDYPEFETEERGIHDQGNTYLNLQYNASENLISQV